MTKKTLTIIILSSFLFSAAGFQNITFSQTKEAAETATLGTFTAISEGAGAAVDTAAATASVLSVPTMDAANAAGWASLFHLVLPGQEGKKTTERWIDKVHRILKSILKKRILDRMVDQIINWIQGDGKPKFITDWGGFLKDAANAGFGDVLQELDLGFLCEPFSAQLRFYLTPPPKFSQEVTCTMDDVVNNIKDFADDFRNGSWIAYEYAWRPENNSFGVYLMATDEIIAKAEGRKEAAKAEGIAGNGFLSTKDEHGEITTPGSYIAKLATKSIDVDIDWLINTEEIEDYIAAIADSAINRLIKEGVKGIRGVSTKAPSSGYYSSYNVPSEIKESWESYVDINKEIKIEGKNIIFDQIREELNYREESIVYILDSKDAVQQALMAEENLFSCLKEQNLNTEETEKRIFDLKEKITYLETQKENEEKKINDLEKFRDRVDKITDYREITEALKEAREKVKYLEAYKAKEHYKEESKTIKKEMEEITKQAQDDSTKCQNYNLPANQ